MDPGMNGARNSQGHSANPSPYPRIVATFGGGVTESTVLTQRVLLGSRHSHLSFTTTGLHIPPSIEACQTFTHIASTDFIESRSQFT